MLFQYFSSKWYWLLSMHWSLYSLHPTQITMSYLFGLIYSLDGVVGSFYLQISFQSLSSFPWKWSNTFKESILQTRSSGAHNLRKSLSKRAILTSNWVRSSTSSLIKLGLWLATIWTSNTFRLDLKSMGTITIKSRSRSISRTLISMTSNS